MMERCDDWRAYATGLPRVLAAALSEFAQQGYHGTSIRDIAAAAGLSVPGVYHHYRSKQEILEALLGTIMEDLLWRSRCAVETATPEPGARFDVLVDHLLRYHMVCRREAFVVSNELRSLTGAGRDVVVARRDAQQRMIVDAIEEGRAGGVFSTPIPRDAARGVASLCVGVASWYVETGPLGPDELAGRYLSLARAMVGATP